MTIVAQVHDGFVAARTWCVAEWHYLAALVFTNFCSWCTKQPEAALQAQQRIVKTASTLWRTLRSLTMLTNPLQFATAALTIGTDAVKLYQDISQHDKAGAVQAVLDVLPVIASIMGKPATDLQAVVTADVLGAAWDAEQDVVKLLPLVEAALAMHQAPTQPA